MSESQDYTLTAIISANRFGNSSINVSKSVSELNIYENIRNPFLSGQIAILDDNGLINSIKFKGTETLTVTIANPPLGVAPIVKTFVITEIISTVQINDNSEMFVLGLVEPHLFYSRATPMSRSYSGSPHNIITRILTDDIINKRIVHKHESTSIQGPMKVAFPYIEPLQAVELLRGRMTNSEGFPYLLYSTLHQNDIIMDNLGDALKRSTWNSQAPFIYSQANASSRTDTMARLTSIEKFIRPNADNTLTTLLSGAVGSRFSVFDTTYGQEVYSSHHNIDETLKPLIDDDESSQSIFDDDFYIANQKINKLDSRNMFQVVSSNMYDDNFSGFADEPVHSSLHKTKIQARAILSAMDKNIMVLQLPGTLFLVNDQSSVGSRMSINILSNSADSLEYLDVTKSGDYITTAVRHIFRDNKHIVSATVTKLTEKRA